MGAFLATSIHTATRNHDMSAVSSVPTELLLKIFTLATEDSSSLLERFELGPNDGLHKWAETQGYKDTLVRHSGQTLLRMGH